MADLHQPALAIHSIKVFYLRQIYRYRMCQARFADQGSRSAQRGLDAGTAVVIYHGMITAVKIKTVIGVSNRSWFYHADLFG